MSDTALSEREHPLREHDWKHVAAGDPMRSGGTPARDHILDAGDNFHEDAADLTREAEQAHGCSHTPDLTDETLAMDDVLLLPDDPGDCTRPGTRPHQADDGDRDWTAAAAGAAGAAESAAERQQRNGAGHRAGGKHPAVGPNRRATQSHEERRLLLALHQVVWILVQLNDDREGAACIAVDAAVAAGCRASCKQEE